MESRGVENCYRSKRNSLRLSLGRESRESLRVPTSFSEPNKKILKEKKTYGRDINLQVAPLILEGWPSSSFITIPSLVSYLGIWKWRDDRVSMMTVIRLKETINSSSIFCCCLWRMKNRVHFASLRENGIRFVSRLPRHDGLPGRHPRI